ncbi:MAG: sulfotransferase family protein [Actinomycetota bacterium]
MTRLPTFIVIGAAKAGTTALYWYLMEHPQIYMSPMKETNFFAYGVDEDGHLLYGDPELHRFPIKTLQDYRRLFAAAGERGAVGEASPIYLECPQAAGRIHDLIPEARIICGLRDPVDRAYSDYLMYLRNRGRRFDPERDLKPDAAWALPDSHWMRLGHYHEQLSRYFEVFSRDRIHMFLFDDLKESELRVVQGIYQFLAVDPEFEPDLATPHNVGGVPSSMMLERLLTSSRLRRLADPLIPKQAINRLRRLRMRNMSTAPPLPAVLRSELIGRFQVDIDKTAGLIGRDLSSWNS